MSKVKGTPFVLLFAWMLGGCESSDSADRISKLQEQLGRVAQQLNETKKQVDGLQEANQRSIRALEDLTATVERLNSASPASSTGKAAKGGVATTGVNPKEGAQPQAALYPQEKAREGLAARTSSATSPITKGKDGVDVSVHGEDDSLADARQAALSKETGATMVAMSCSQVWKQLGQGKTPESAARALGVSVAAIHACEQKVGRSSASQ